MITATTAPIAPIAPSQVPVDINSLRMQFNDLALDLTRTDQQLEYNQRDRKRPTSGWDTEFDSFAVRLDTARMQFAQVRPDAQDLIYSLGANERLISRTAGKLDFMQNNRSGFKSGWDTVLDGAIRDVRVAASMLEPTVPPTPPVTPPTPPVTPPTPPVTPPGVPSQVREDALRAAGLVQQSIDTLQPVRHDTQGAEATKDARIAAYNANMDAQKLLEQHFTSADAAVASTLRQADATLEDANWQLVKKPSPDGRFNGVDVPGAIRDSQTALELLQTFAAAA